MKTAFLIQGLNQQQLEGFAEYVADEQGTGWLVKRAPHSTGDTGFSSACTHDLEVWSPGTSNWLEVSSCSTFTDFQARRAGLRYRPEKGAKPQLVHTLNGSGLALPRVWIALLESGLQADGSVLLPEALQPFVGGSRITAEGIKE